MPRKLARLSAIAAGALTIAAGPLVLSPAAFAQDPITKPPVASILAWTQKQQLERYPAIEKVYKVGAIKKGDKVYALPAAAQQVNPKVKIGKTSSTVDAFMKTNRVSGLIAIKNGEVVLEKYALGRKPTDRWTSFSVAKSVTSILMGAAIKDGYIKSEYDPVTRYLPELKGTAYDDVSLRQLMTMTTGVKWDETYSNPKSDVAQAGTAPFKGGDPVANNPLLLYMSKLQRAAPAGSVWEYKTGETDLAGIALKRALARQSLSEYASEKLWKPFGMEQDAIWMLDKAGLERGGCCMSMTLRDYARIGLFMLGGGKIDGKSILPDGYLTDATSNHVPGEQASQGASYGYFWWPMDDGYRAVGIFGQGIYVYPEENLVIAMNSALPKATDRAQSQKMAALIAAVRAAANGG
jgi:CubicO group peptidase (beta-lactamase class C family)